MWLAAALLFAGTELAPAPGLPPVEAAPCIACRAPVLDPNDAFSGEDWTQLRAGEVLRGSVEAAGDAEHPERTTHAAELVSRPPAEVWAVLTDFATWPEFMPHITATSILKRDGERVWVTQKYRVLLSTMTHTTIYRPTPAEGRLAWRLDLDSPHDIQSSEGHWQLVPVDDGRATLVRYQARMNAGRAVPDFVERMLLERSLGELLSQLRGEIERRAELRAARK